MCSQKHSLSIIRMSVHHCDDAHTVTCRYMLVHTRTRMVKMSRIMQPSSQMQLDTASHTRQTLALNVCASLERTISAITLNLFPCSHNTPTHYGIHMFYMVYLVMLAMARETQRPVFDGAIRSAQTQMLTSETQSKVVVQIYCVEKRAMTTKHYYLQPVATPHIHTTHTHTYHSTTHSSINHVLGWTANLNVQFAPYTILSHPTPDN